MTHKQALAFMAAALMLSGCGRDDGGESAVGEAPAKPEASTETAAMPRSPAPENARLFFITPNDGDTVGNPITVEFGLEGMEVAKAGTDKPHSGHHHLIIDADLPDLGMPIPASDNYIHFGDGSTSTEITLEPGQHTLRLLLGDHMHVPHDPPVYSEEITITVE
jgi:hypothetical protein